MGNDAVTPTLDDGTTPVYLLEIENADKSDIVINSSDYPDCHVDEAKIYAYLPAKSFSQPNIIELGENTAKYFYDTANSKWIKIIENIAITIAAPTAGAAFPQAEVPESVSAEIVWKKDNQAVSGNAEYNTAYTAEINITPQSGYAFGSSVSAKVNGNNVDTTNTNGTITVKYTFDTTGKDTVKSPTASPAGGIYTETQIVMLSCETEGAVIYYTTDGTVPTVNNTEYTSPITVMGTEGQSVTTIIKAIAVKDGMNNSDIVEFEYIINLNHIHSYGAEWKFDNTNHWHECECGGKADEAAHIESDWIIVKEATGDTDGVQQKVCTVCGRILTTSTIPKVDYPVYPIDPANYIPYIPLVSSVPGTVVKYLDAEVELDGSTATLSWNEITNVDYYSIYQYKDGKYVEVKTTEKTKVIIKNLKNGKDYKFLVRYTVNGRLSSKYYSDHIEFTAYYKPVPEAEVIGNSVRLTWKAVPGAEKYAVYKYTDGKAVKLIETEKRSVIINKLKPNTEYNYIVRAYVDGKWTTMTKSDIVTVTTE